MSLKICFPKEQQLFIHGEKQEEHETSETTGYFLKVQGALKVLLQETFPGLSLLMILRLAKTCL